MSASASAEDTQDGQSRSVPVQSSSGLDEQQTQSDESTKKRSKASRRARRTNVDKSETSITTSAIEQGAVQYLSNSPSLAEIEDDIDLTYTNRFNKAAKYLKVTDNVKVLKPSVDTLAALLCAGPTRGRQYSVSLTFDSADSEPWMFGIRNDADINDRVRVGKSKKDYSSTISIDRSVAQEEAQGLLIAEQLCRIFERLPFSEPRKGAIFHHCIEIATRLAIPLKQEYLPRVAPSDKKRKEGKLSFYYGTKWTVFDINTGKSFQHTVSIPVEKCNVNLALPSLSDNIVKQELKLHESCPDDDRERHTYAFDLARYITKQLHGKMATKESLKSLTDTHKARFLGDAHAMTGPYGGKPLYQVRPEGQATSKTLSIYPSRWVTKSLQWTSKKVQPESADRLLTPIRVRPATFARVLPVVSYLTQTWLSTGNIMETWGMTCMYADEVNASDTTEILQQDICTCTEESSHTEAHPCNRCGKPEICAALCLSDQHGKICRLCSEGQHDGNDIMVRRVIDAVINESKLLGVDAEWCKSERALILDHLKQNFQVDGKWKSAHTGRILETVDLGSARAKHPGNVSLDATKPLHRTDDGTLRLHVIGNLVPTELALNFLKHVYPVGILEIVKEWVCSEQKTADRNMLVQKMSDLVDVHLQLPYVKAARIGQKMPAARWNVLESELISCKLAGSKKSISRKDEIAGTHRPDWYPKEIDVVKKVIREIEQRFDRTIPRGTINGCPVPFDGISVPEHWTWWTAWKLFGIRCHRMWLYCNGKWIQIDCIVTIFLECIWQYLDPTESADFLHLPMTIEIRSPLRFAIAHRHHGQAMRSRWEQPQPRSIADRDDEKTNMSIEASISNYFKHNFDEKYYDYLHELVKSINLDSSLYNVDARISDNVAGEEYMEDEEARISMEGGLIQGTEIYEKTYENVDVEESGAESDDDGDNHD